MLNFKKFTAFGNRVLVKRAEALTKSKGGILLQTSQECQYGEVVQTGPGMTFPNGNLRPTGVKIGQTVLLPNYSGVKLTLANEEEFWLYRDDDIMAILEEPVKQ